MHMADLFTMVLNKVDDSFSVQDTRNYGLYIQFDESGFVYTILDTRKNKFLVLQQMMKNEFQPQAVPAPAISFNDFLKSILNAVPWLKNPYKQIKIAYEGQKFTLIPGPLFDAGEVENYLRLHFSLSKEETALSDHLIPLDNHLGFSIPVSTLNSIRAFFPSGSVNHITSVIAEGLWINYKNRILSNRVFLHMREKRFDLMIFDGKQMTYLNTFNVSNEDDIAYYLIFVLEQLNLNPENIHAILLGAVERNSHLQELLTRYVKHIEFGRRNEAFRYPYVFNQIPPQAFYSLLNYPSCGL